MKLLEGKVALVTGGTRGIGKAICTCFAQHGAQVVFTYLSSTDKAKALEKELTALSKPSKAIQLDGSNFEAVQKRIEELIDTVGKIDILVNNAGITKDNLLMRMNEQQWDQVMDANLKSVFNFTKALQKNFLKQRSGSIINLSSVVGVKGNAGQSNYAASKAGIIGFSKSIAQELGSRNIRCNVVAPGFIQTEMTDSLDQTALEAWNAAIPLKRPGNPEEVAQSVLFLASDLSSYISGEVLHVNGAMYT